MALERTNSDFPATSWTLVAGASGEPIDVRLSRLIEAYWPAVYAFLRRSGRNRDAAAELTQGFFTDVVLGRGLFESADASRGRLRSLMIAALQNYVRDAHRREAARGAGRLRPLDQAWIDREEGLAPTDACDAERAFDRRWALAQVEEALRRCERHFHDSGKPAHWALFEARVVRPAMRAVEPPPLAALADELGFASAADAAAAVQVVKRRTLALLEDVVAESAGDHAEQELRACLECFAGGGG